MNPTDFRAKVSQRNRHRCPRTKLVALGGGAGLVLFASAGLALAGETRTVTVGDNFFQPTEVRIAPGDTVEWRWVGRSPHNVAAEELAPVPFRSRIVTSGTFRRTFTTPGVYRYICQVHPREMRARVVVGNANADRTPPRITSLSVRPAKGSVSVTVRFSEKVRAKVQLSGRSARSTIKTLGPGSAKLVFKGLRPGQYKVAVVAQDFAANRASKRSRSFTVR